MRELLFPKICFVGFQYFIFQSPYGKNVFMVANTTGQYWANHMRGHWKLLAWPHRGWSLILKLCICLHRAQIALRQANAYLAWFPPLSRLWQQNKTKPAMLLGCGITFAVYLWRVTRYVYSNFGEINRNLNIQKDVVYQNLYATKAVQSLQNCYHFRDNHRTIIAEALLKAAYYGGA